MPCALVHYHELALKGRNRGYFEERLAQHLRNSLHGTGVTQVASLPGRMRVSFNGSSSWEAIQNGISHTFGVANFCLAYKVSLHHTKPDLASLCHEIAKLLSGRVYQTFRIITKRGDKRFPKTSMDISREVGAFLCEVTGKRVSLNAPDLTVYIELVNNMAYFYLSREQGPGGLPTGISGKVLCLISGGIDSPVAAYRMMKRGCQVIFVHFHGQPYLSRASEEKVREIVAHLTRYQLHSLLYFIPFGEIQRQIVLQTPAPVRVVLYRRMMMRIAEKIAKKEQSWGLVTGDSLGQVASQTAENIQVISEAPQLEILRPLIGMDKIEITNEAKHIGTFETSIEPDQDCCTLFVPPHPNTKCRLDYIKKVEKSIDIVEMVNTGIECAQITDISYPPHSA